MIVKIYFVNIRRAQCLMIIYNYRHLEQTNKIQIIKLIIGVQKTNSSSILKNQNESQVEAHRYTIKGIYLNYNFEKRPSFEWNEIIIFPYKPEGSMDLKV